MHFYFFAFVPRVSSIKKRPIFWFYRIFHTGTISLPGLYNYNLSLETELLLYGCKQTAWSSSQDSPAWHHTILVLWILHLKGQNPLSLLHLLPFLPVGTFLIQINDVGHVLHFLTEQQNNVAEIVLLFFPQGQEWNFKLIIQAFIFLQHTCIWSGQWYTSDWKTNMDQIERCCVSVRCTNSLCHLSMANTDEVMGAFKRTAGRQMKRETMTERQCVSLQPRAMCSMLTAWLGSVPEAYSEPRTAPLVSQPAHWGETHLDKVSLSLFIAPVFFPLSETRSVSSGSPHLAALSSFVCRSIETLRGTSNL